MITAQELRRLSELTASKLSALLGPKTSFESAEFLGLTNGGQFCYKVVVDGGELAKVFVTRKLDGSLGVELL